MYSRSVLDGHWRGLTTRKPNGCIQSNYAREYDVTVTLERLRWDPPINPCMAREPSSGENHGGEDDLEVVVGTTVYS